MGATFIDIRAKDPDFPSFFNYGIKEVFFPTRNYDYPIWYMMELYFKETHLLSTDEQPCIEGNVKKAGSKFDK